MTNDYFNSDGQPGDATKGIAKRTRKQFEGAEDGFDKLPNLAPLIVGLTYVAPAGGVVNAYTATISDKITSYLDGLRISFFVGVSNTGASTIDVNGMGVKSIKAEDGSELSGADLLINTRTLIEYNATAGYFAYIGPVMTTATAAAITAAAAAAITPMNQSRATVASHATTSDIWGALGNQINFTGTETVTSFPSAPNSGPKRELICAAGCSITASANMLIVGVSSGDTILCAANDKLIVEAITTTQFLVRRTKYNGTSEAVGMVLRARTSNTILGHENSGDLIDITSGTFTQTFDIKSNLGANWFVILKNSGDGDITLDPVGGIDGVSTFVMYPGETRLIQNNGTDFYSIVLNGFSKSFLSSDTFIKPPGYIGFLPKLWSAGNSGQRTGSSGALAEGGGGGGCYEQFIASEDVGVTESVVVGAGGAAVTTAANGNQGGNTSFGLLLAVYFSSNFNHGGSVGYGASIQESTGINAGFAGSGLSGGYSVWGGAGGVGVQGSFTNGGNSINGGAGGGGVSAASALGTPGLSLHGGNGGAGSLAGNGVDGVQPGGGGGGTQTGTQSGAGADGQCDIKGVI